MNNTPLINKKALSINKFNFTFGALVLSVLMMNAKLLTAIRLLPQLSMKPVALLMNMSVTLPVSVSRHQKIFANTSEN